MRLSEILFYRIKRGSKNLSYARGYISLKNVYLYDPEGT